MTDPQQPEPYPHPSGYPAPSPSPEPALGAAPQFGPAGQFGPAEGFSPAPATGSLGLVALIVALAGFALNLLFSIFAPALIGATIRQPETYFLINGANTVIAILIGAVALVLGIIAARRGTQRVLAGMAIGLGGGLVVGHLVFAVQGLLMWVLR